MESESRQNSGPQHKLLHDQKKKKALEGSVERERDPSPLSLRQRAFSSRADRRESGRLRSRSLLFVCVCFFLQVDVDWD